MPIIGQNFTALEKVLNGVYNVEMGTKKDYVSRLFNVEKSTRSKEERVGLNNLGLMQADTGTINYDSFSQKDLVQYIHAKYSNGLQIPIEEYQIYKEYSKLKTKTKQLADSAHLTRQYHGASVFNNAFTAGSTGGSDAVCLCSASHPLSNEDASVQNNVGTLSLTSANIDTVMTSMRNMTDDRENMIGLNPSLLLVGNSYAKKAKEITGSDKEPYTTENQINVWSDELTHLVFPYITGNKWFIIDPNMMNRYLRWFDVKKPKIEHVLDFDNEQLKFKTVGIWSFGWDEWSWIYGNDND